MTGESRKEAAKSMKNVKAARYQVDQAKNLMESSDLVPAHIPNLPVIRKIQQEERDDSLSLDLYPGDPFTSLQKVQEQNTFVHYLSADPFCIHLATEEQLKLYQEALNLGYNSFSIDASGFYMQLYTKGSFHVRAS